MNQNTINTAKFSAALRQKGIRPAEREVLVTCFAGSEQEHDLSLPPNCRGWGRIHHFRRSQGAGWPENPLPIEPAANALGIEVPDMESSVYLWSDDNLSNDFLWRYLGVEEQARLASFRNYGRVGCFKGFDAKSFAFNTGAEDAMFDLQFRTARRLIETGLDVYGYVTLTSLADAHLTRRMSEFVERLQAEIHPIFPLRMVPLRIAEFTPTKTRMRPEYVRALDIQYVAVQAWREEIESRFSEHDRCKRIFEHRLK